MRLLLVLFCTFLVALYATCPDCGFPGRKQVTQYVLNRHLARRPRSCRWFKLGRSKKKPSLLNKLAKRKYHTLKRAATRKRTHRPKGKKADVCILQYEDRIGLPYYEVLAAVNRSYAVANGYTFVRKEAPASERHGTPPYWQKVFEVADALEKYRTVLFLDSDACIHHSGPLPRKDERSGLHMAGTTFYMKGFEYNTGVFIASGRKGKQLMKLWKGLLTPEVLAKWSVTDEEGKKVWQCSGAWAGPKGRSMRICKIGLLTPVVSLF